MRAEVKVLEHIWEFVQEVPQGFTNKSFDDLGGVCFFT